MNDTMTFGKYNGKSVYEVFSNDKAYCRWLITQGIDKPEISEINRLFAIENRLEMASFDLSRGKESATVNHLSLLQNMGLMTEEQGVRFMDLVEKSAEYGWIELG